MRDASFPTFLLTHWTRDRQSARLSVEEVVKRLAFDPRLAASPVRHGDRIRDCGLDFTQRASEQYGQQRFTRRRFRERRGSDQQ